MSEHDERFDSKWTLDPETGCWIWTASRDRKGYGQFSAGGRRVQAHRWAWKRANGKIPDGMQCDHFRMNDPATCHTCSKACVNPEHLELVTHQQNNARSFTHRETARRNGRRNGRRTGRRIGLANRRHDLPEGVSHNRKGFQARIWNPQMKTRINLGTFDTPDEAHQRYLMARSGFIYGRYIRLPGISAAQNGGE